MKKSKYSDEEIVTILREVDELPIDQVAKKRNVSTATIYAWRKRFGGMDANDVKLLKQLQSENAKLKKLLADRLLEIDVLKECNAKKW